MNVAAVVPVKALGAAKSRLGAVLDERARATLALWLVDRVITAVRASGAVASLAIVSPDASALAWAASVGITALPQRGGDLNDGLELGRQWARAAGAQALLVLLGDLPLLAHDDVRALVALAAETAERDSNAAGVAVLAPDRAGTGTNALLLAPAGALPFAFGPDSHRRHLALARRRGLLVATYRAPGTAFDVDRPADLDELCQAGLWPVGALQGPCAAASGRTDGPGI